ncbi:MAG TPA: Gfo/Idh/MocA family oxidoreductase, partial [Thermoleophilaceae bacterium]|nr:Gfo/Idh/MocA family oxidoreductase [Thermoleophilaceae bacterium]
PEGLDARWGAFGAVGAIGGHGVRTARVEAGAVVVVIGLGLVGQIAAQLSTAAGARVVGIDPAADRVALATRLGAVGGAALGSDDPEEVTRRHSSGRGADAVIVAAAAGDSGPVELAAEIARDRATVCVVGDVGLDVPRRPFYEKELELRISRSYGPGRYDAAYEQEGVDYPIGYVRWTERRLIEYFLEEARGGRVQLEDLVTHELPIERGAEAYEALSSGSRMAILLRYAAEEDSPTRTPVSAEPRSSSGRLRVGLIGPGLFARSVLLPQIAELDAELVAVAGTTPARAFGVAKRWGADYAARAPEELIEDDSIDAVVITTRHDTHAELTAQAIERGKAVFCEKPLAIDHDGLDRLRPLLKGDAPIVVGFNRGLSPAATQTQEHFTGRADPLSITYRVNAGFLERDHWLRARALGGGRLVGEACHFVDLASSLVGRPLTSVGAAALGDGPITLEDDSFVLTLDYDDGSIATVTYVASGHARMPKERVEVLGGGRSAVIDDFRRVERFPSKRQLVPTPPRRTDKGHGALLEQALRFFREGGPPPVPYERILETTEATLMARDALDAGRREPVPLPAQ